jgi:hypothetical protein
MPTAKPTAISTDVLAARRTHRPSALKRTKRAMSEIVHFLCIRLGSAADQPVEKGDSPGRRERPVPNTTSLDSPDSNDSPSSPHAPLGPGALSTLPTHKGGEVNFDYAGTAVDRLAPLFSTSPLSPPRERGILTVAGMRSNRSSIEAEKQVPCQLDSASVTSTDAFKLVHS